MSIGEKDNERAIRATEVGLNRAWDIFLYGSDGIRPGSVEAYGAISGLREVRKERLKIREELNSQERE